eukprot:7844426-Karenia_brevis.AAC.1
MTAFKPLVMQMSIKVHWKNNLADIHQSEKTLVTFIRCSMENIYKIIFDSVPLQTNKNWCSKQAF